MLQVLLRQFKRPLRPVAGRLNAIGAITGRVSGKLLLLLGGFTLAAVAIGKFVSMRCKSRITSIKIRMHYY